MSTPISPDADENRAATFRYQTALPISNGRLAMFVFLSTEVMLFAALLSSYVVLRYSGVHGWPAAEEVGINRLTGAINTAILALSALTMWLAVRNCRQGIASNARIWLSVTLLLGITFLCVKAFEYREKFDVGIFPGGGRSLIYNAADDKYLSRAVREMRAEIRRVEQLASEGKLEEKQKRLEELYLIQSGIVDWTQFVVGRSGDLEFKRAAISALAHQIHHRQSDPAVEKFIAEEKLRIGDEKNKLNQELDQISNDRSASQKRLRELLPKKDSGDAETLRQFDVVSDQVVRFDEEIVRLNKEIQPIENRLAAVQNVSSSGGINELYEVRLPIVIAGGHKRASLYYLLTGTHAIHLIAGLVPMMFLACCRLERHWLPTMENLSLYWHFVDVVWLIVFAVMYLT